MAAKEDKLGSLHEKVAEVLTVMLEGTTLEAEYDAEGVEVAAPTVIPPSAATITAAIQFLKNNNITCVPDESNSLGRLKEAQERRAAERDARKGALKGTAPRDFVAGPADFLDGLPKH